MVKNGSKIAYLDGIRGVAALIVFFYHFLQAFYSSFYTLNINTSHLNGLEIKYGQSIWSVFSNGHFCVCIFFVLSGLVLSRKYFQTGQFEIIVSGAQRRFLRLYIPVAFTLILSFVLIKSNLYFNTPVSTISLSEWLASQWQVPDPLARLWLCLKMGTMFQGDNSFDISLWTMVIELTGSLFVFAFLAFTHNVKNRFACLALVLVYCKFTQQAFLSAFMLGIGLNFVEQYISRVNKYLANSLAVVLLLFGLLLGSSPTSGEVKGTIFEHVPSALAQYSGYHLLGAFLLVLSFVMSPVLQRIISLRPFRFLGHISFSLYLLHPLFIGSFGCFVFLKIYGRFDYGYSVAIVFLLTTIVCLFLSWLMARYVDDPGIQLSKYVYKRWIKKKPAPQPVEILPQN